MLPKPTMTRRPEKATCFLSSMADRDADRGISQSRVTSPTPARGLQPACMPAASVRPPCAEIAANAQIGDGACLSALLAAGARPAAGEERQGRRLRAAQPVRRGLRAHPPGCGRAGRRSKLIGAAIAGMLSGLDAHSAYISEAAIQGDADAGQDDQASLGLVVTIDNGQVKVVSPQDGSPAARPASSRAT